MGYSALSVDAKRTLMEIARMAYGTGKKEGRLGGEGRMGLVTVGGTPRVIKFNTQLKDRLWGPSVADDPAMLESSNELRKLLVSISEQAALDPAVMNEIRVQLGLPLGANTANELLDRRNVASVLSLIGGNELWDEALDGHGDMSAYRSADSSRFREILGMTPAAGGGQRNMKEVEELKEVTTSDFRTLCEDKLKTCTLEVRLEDSFGQGAVAIAEKIQAAVDLAFSSGFVNNLHENGYLQTISKADVSRAFGDLLDEVAALPDWREKPEAVSDQRLASYICRRLPALLKGDRQLLTAYGPQARADALALRGFGLEPKEIERMAEQMTLRYGFVDHERDEIVRMTLAVLVGQIRAQRPDEVRAKVDVIRRELAGGVCSALVGAMVICKVNADRQSVLLQRAVGGWTGDDERKLDGAKAGLLLAYFDELSKAGGFNGDVRDHWTAYAQFLLDENGGNLVELANAEGILTAVREELPGYLEDNEAAQVLQEEISAFCREHAGYGALLRVPPRSFANCIGGAKANSFREPYARYVFEMVKRIVERFAPYDGFQVTPQVAEAMLNGQFGDLPGNVGDEAKAFMGREATEVILNMRFSKHGLNGELGASFDEALNRTVSTYVNPPEKHERAKQFLQTLLTSELLDRGPCRSADDLQAVVRTLVGEAGDHPKSMALSVLLASAKTDDFNVIVSSGIDLLKVLRALPDWMRMMACGHVLARELRQHPGESFVGREEELVQKVKAFHEFLSSKTLLPSELQFADHELNIFAIVALACPDIDLLASSDPATVKTLPEYNQFVERAKAIMDTLRAAVAGMVTHFGVDANDAQAVRVARNMLTASLANRMSSTTFYEVVSDQDRLNGFLATWKDHAQTFVELKRGGKVVLEMLAAIGPGMISSEAGLFGADLLKTFTGLPLLGAAATVKAAKLSEQLETRKAALQRYANRQKAEQFASRESRARKVAAAILQRMLGSLNVKFFDSEERLEELYVMLYEMCAGEDGICREIEAGIAALEAAESDEARFAALANVLQKLQIRTFLALSAGSSVFTAIFPPKTEVGAEEAIALLYEVPWGILELYPNLKATAKTLMRRRRDLVVPILHRIIPEVDECIAATQIDSFANINVALVDRLHGEM